MCVRVGVHVCVLGWVLGWAFMYVLGWAFMCMCYGGRSCMCVRLGVHLCVLVWVFMYVC